MLLDRPAAPAADRRPAPRRLHAARGDRGAAARRARARLVGCALGLALGEELSIQLFHSNPGFLSLAFAVGSGAGRRLAERRDRRRRGMLAAIVAVLSPLRDILSRDPLAAIAPREVALGRTQHTPARRARGPSRACLGAATAILLVAPQAAIAGMVAADRARCCLWLPLGARRDARARRAPRARR